MCVLSYRLMHCLRTIVIQSELNVLHNLGFKYRAETRVEDKPSVPYGSSDFRPVRRATLWPKPVSNPGCHNRFSLHLSGYFLLDHLVNL
jgi:hypothetical protein